MPKAPSRAKRFETAQGAIAEAKSEFECLRDELQDWHDNLPENLQSSNKADMLQSAIDELETCINACDEIESASPEFPGMFS